MDQKWDMEILSVEKFAERYEELFHRSFEWRGRLQFRKKNIYEEKKQHLDTVYYRTDLFLLSTRQR